MRTVKKSRLSRPYAMLITFGVVLALLIGAAIVINRIASKDEGGEVVNPDPPYVNNEIGESIYLNNATAYPYVEADEVLSLFVSGKNGDFMIKRWPDDNGSFLIFYDEDGDGEGETMQYMPPIVDKENSFNYESLYAVETEDGIGRIYLLTYLCASLGAPTISERIELPAKDDVENKEKRELLLKDYGFGGDDFTAISFDYGYRDEKGNITSRGSHTVILGGRALNGAGFYYIVDGRDYIYYTKSNYFEYATRGFYSFVKGQLVAAGLESDSTFEPYLTSDFKEWVNTKHSEAEEEVLDGANVIAKGEELIPSGGGLETLSFDLDKLRAHKDYERIRKALVGRRVGVDYSDSPILISMVTDYGASSEREIDFSNILYDSHSYSYEILSIESILTEDGENVEKGTPVSKDQLVKISYRLKVDGKARGDILYGAVDLSESEELSSALVGLTVGELAEPKTVKLNYTKENSHKVNRRLVVSSIIEIFDAKGESVNKVESDSYVKIRYYEEINGVRGEERVSFMSLSDTENDTMADAVKLAILGKGKTPEQQEIKVVVYDRTAYYEYSREVVTYSVSKIEYFVTSKLVVSFRFKNASERDPYYGESFYENTLENKYSFYGLNAATCEAVVRVLGGIGEDSAQSLGLSGKTVALGLTPETMDRFGLYAYTVYFELPRGIYDKTEGTEDFDENELSDYEAYGTLGFTLYISEADPETGKRYIGSDLYDLVAEVDGENFIFLDYGFSEFWARRNLVLLDISNVDKIRLEFNMEDLKGDYLFDLNMETKWGGIEDGVYKLYPYPMDGFTEVDMLYVTLSASGECTETELTKYLAAKELDKISATELYNQIVGGGKPTYEYASLDSIGVSNFKSAFEKLQLTRYENLLTPEEQANAANAPRIMRLHLKINQSSFYYTYDFYRVDDRKVMVKLYRSDENGYQVGTSSVSEFYLSTYSFKVVAGSFLDFLNCKEINLDTGYPEHPLSKEEE